ncbi:MAG: hypothetical protein NZ901_07170 [Geminocystis sp.]|nr:hypothetical protein [Geminocystis sp.]MCS7147955.1 hypothetical protein [Geminocystis sp.]MDW8116849.1 hypothetical protein [Geminocystis sp.]
MTVVFVSVILLLRHGNYGKAAGDYRIPTSCCFLEMMMAKFQRLLEYFHNYRQFSYVWLATLVVVIFLGTICHYFPQKDETQALESPSRRVEYGAIVIVFLFLIFYSHLILYGEDFAYHDNSQFTLFTLKGDFYVFPIWPSVGRFWPLGFQEYNVISLFSTTPFAFHLFSVFQLFITAIVCYLLLLEFKPIYRILVIIAIITVPSFVVSFSGLIFPERNVIFWLAIFILAFDKYSKNRRLLFAILTLISTQFILYYKEPVFLLILGFIISHLLLKGISGVKKANQKSNSNNIVAWLQNNYLEILVLFQVLVFIALFIYFVYGLVKNPYGVTEKKSILWTLATYLKTNLLLCIFLLYLPIRLLMISQGKSRVDPLWDSLAVGGLLYFLAYIKLGLFRWYYIAPVDFVAILYLVKTISVNVISESDKSKRIWRGVFAILLSAMIVGNLQPSAYAILVRKKDIESRVRAADFIKRYHENKNKVTLFFPSKMNPGATGYYMMEFAAFLEYKGIPVFSLDNYGSVGIRKPILMKGEEEYTNNLCVQYRRFICLPVSQPSPGDLFIILPPNGMIFSPELGKDDVHIWEEDIENYSKKYRLIFHYKPEFRGVERILYFLCRNKIPKEWYNAYIFLVE